MTLQAIGRPFVFDLLHNVVCASTGRCTCKQRELPRRVLDGSGRPTVRYETRLVPKSVTLLVGKPQDVQVAVVRIPRVQRAIARGRLASV